MKRLILIFSVFISLALSSGAVYAADVFPNCGAGSANGVPDVCTSVNEQNGNNSSNPVVVIIRTAIEIVSYLTGLLALIFIIVSAIKFMTSGGDSNSVASARTSLIYALVGIVVTIAAQAIIVFVLNKVHKV